MTLSGNLGFVPLDEVLRLLTRAGNDGMVQITNSKASGRIFVAGSGITLATTLGDYGLKDHLISSGYITEDQIASVESGDSKLGDIFEVESEGLSLLREMTVESIYQLDSDDSDFQVVKDEKTAYATSDPFDLEAILRDSRERAGQWAKVSSVIPDLGATLRINRSLTTDTVELRKESWRIISELGSGASVEELAGRLGTTEFSVAKVAAEMVENDLLGIEEGASVAEPGYSAVETVVTSHEPETSYDSGADYQVHEVAEEAESAHDKSWWDEPETEESTDDAMVAQSEEHSEEHSEEQVDDLVEANYGNTGVSLDDDVSAEGFSNNEDSEETDAFLEKVFSELGPESDDSDDGHGLMRRRRMGSILRELGEE